MCFLCFYNDNALRDSPPGQGSGQFVACGDAVVSLGAEQNWVRVNTTILLFTLIFNVSLLPCFQSPGDWKRGSARKNENIAKMI